MLRIITLTFIVLASMMVGSIQNSQAQVTALNSSNSVPLSGYPQGSANTKLRVGSASTYAGNSAAFEVIGTSSLPSCIYLGRAGWNQHAMFSISGLNATNRGLVIGVGNNASSGSNPSTAVSTAKFMFTSNGRLGINDSDPIGHLTVFAPTNPNMVLRSSSHGFIEFAIASFNGHYAGRAQAGDAVIRKLGAGHILLNIPTTQESGTKSVEITDDDNAIFTAWNGGKVHIGVSTPYSKLTDGYKLFVDQGILTEKIKVQLKVDWADYVFGEGYVLLPLAAVDTFTKTHHHLPGMPSAQDLEEDGGVELLDMTIRQQVKIEELYLYLIQLNERLEALEAENEALKAVISE